jgi:glycosyltransferase involved in cell wall biosynthesis
VFIQPSFKETFGLSYFEAMACGLPVILTRNTGAYEMIKDKDVYYLVDPHEPATIMNCLQGIISDRETLVRKATTAPEVAKIASWGPFVAYFHEKYEEVVNNCHSECSEAE